MRGGKVYEWSEREVQKLKRKKKAKVERKTVMKGIYFVVDRTKKFELCTDTHTHHTHTNEIKKKKILLNISV